MRYGVDRARLLLAMGTVRHIHDKVTKKPTYYCTNTDMLAQDRWEEEILFGLSYRHGSVEHDDLCRVG